MGIEHRSVDVGTVRLHVVQEGHGKPVILLHGFPEFWYSWRHQIPALASSGRMVIAPDLRGYNLSDKPRGVSRYRMEYLVDDIIGLMSVHGFGSADLVGHDWGGVIAWCLAARHPERVGKLAILNAPHPTQMARAMLGTRQLLRSWYIFFFQVPAIPERLVLRPGMIDRVVRAWSPDAQAWSEEDLARYEEALRTPFAARSALAYYRAALRHPVIELPIVRCPTMVIWGERDQCLGPELLDGLEHRAPAVTIHRIPWAGHFVQQEAPAEVNALLLRFLALEAEKIAAASPA